jgi:bifunctional UDP-N-acetylglucosamine pyrophosphorylase / glucosamine-1-phosphate N-acetyltransferase
MKSNSHLSVVILAAGKGTRMKSAKAKVLHEVFFQPMLHHVLESVRQLEPSRCIVVVGHQEEAVRESLEHYDVELVRQEHQLGTGHAVQMAQSAVPEENGVVMILCGDTPLISSESLREMYRNHLVSRSVLTVMTTIVDNPTGYGRIISAGDSVLAIVEEKETDELQRKIQEINAGIYLVERTFLFEALASLTPDNSQGEFYLTDIVAYAVSQKQQPLKFLNPAADEVLGVNSKVELETAQRQLQQRRNQELMRQGVTIHDRATVTVSPQTDIGSDTLLYPGVFISGKSTIGSNCILENGAILHNCTIGDNTRIGAYCVLRNCKIGNDASIPPMTLREH